MFDLHGMQPLTAKPQLPTNPPHYLVHNYSNPFPRHLLQAADLLFQIETLQEKIISLELTNSQEESNDSKLSVNGKKCNNNDEEGEDEPESEPATPTTEELPSFGEETAAPTGKKKKRRRSRKGRN